MREECRVSAPLIIQRRLPHDVQLFQERHVCKSGEKLCSDHSIYLDL
jgi:hypothetical protein